MEFFARSYSINSSVYRVFVMPEAGKISTKHIPLPLAPFEVGLRLPMDPAFVDFLIYARVQPNQIHLNAICTILALIVLCRRLGFEFSINILIMFFSSLRMTDNNLSLRPRMNKVQLLDSLPNKVDFRGRWMMVESRIDFPFRPSVGEKIKWTQIKRTSSIDSSERAFVEAIT